MVLPYDILLSNTNLTSFIHLERAFFVNMCHLKKFYYRLTNIIFNSYHKNWCDEYYANGVPFSRNNGHHMSRIYEIRIIIIKVSDALTLFHANAIPWNQCLQCNNRNAILRIVSISSQKLFCQTVNKMNDIRWPGQTISSNTECVMNGIQVNKPSLVSR